MAHDADTDRETLTAFISYSHQRDRKAAIAVEKRLQREETRDGKGRRYKWHVVLARKYAAGTDWKNEIERHIDGADCVIALISDASMESEWCAKEWTIARALHDRRKRPHIIPLRLDNSRRIPDSFTNIQIGRLNKTESDRPTEHFEECIRTAEVAKREHDFWGDAFYEHELQLAVPKRRFVGGSLQTDVKGISRRAKPEGVDYWQAVQDIRAAVELTNKLTKERGVRGIQVVHGKDVDLSTGSRCAIALGLGFNKLTRLLEQRFGKKLYKVTFGPSARPVRKRRTTRRRQTLITDDFLLPGSKARKLPHRFDRALIARVVLPAETAAGYCVYFICAGRTAPGTVAAAWFLANRWRKLLGLYGGTWSLTKDSVAAILWHPRNGTMDGVRYAPASHEDVWYMKGRAPGF
jgi:hypothetical protein